MVSVKRVTLGATDEYRHQRAHRLQSGMHSYANGTPTRMHAFGLIYCWEQPMSTATSAPTACK